MALYSPVFQFLMTYSNYKKEKNRQLIEDNFLQVKVTLTGPI